MRLLSRKARTTKRRARRRIYEEAERNALILLWEAGDRVYGRRLKALTPVSRRDAVTPRRSVLSGACSADRPPPPSPIYSRSCDLRPNGSPSLPASPFQRAVSNTPADQTGACVDYFPVCAAFPGQKTGRRLLRLFRGLLARHLRYGPPNLAQTPMAAFVARLRPGRSPRRTARQVPDQSTTLRVEASSTGDTRLRGALLPAS